MSSPQANPMLFLLSSKIVNLMLLGMLLVQLIAVDQATAEDILLVNQPLKTPATCAQIIGNNAENDEKLLLCQLYESSSLLTQLGALVSQGLDRLMVSQGVLPLSNSPIADEHEALESGQREKKKHEYLRFGKRKHEYLRFGKRKHEYLRFG